MVFHQYGCGYVSVDCLVARMLYCKLDKYSDPGFVEMQLGSLVKNDDGVAMG